MTKIKRTLLLSALLMAGSLALAAPAEARGFGGGHGGSHGGGYARMGGFHPSFGGSRGGFGGYQNGFSGYHASYGAIGGGRGGGYVRGPGGFGGGYRFAGGYGGGYPGSYGGYGHRYSQQNGYRSAGYGRDYQGGEEGRGWHDREGGYRRHHDDNYDNASGNGSPYGQPNNSGQYGQLPSGGGMPVSYMPMQYGQDANAAGGGGPSVSWDQPLPGGGELSANLSLP